MIALNSMITPEAIIKVVCDYYHTEKDIVIAKRRFTEHIRARHLAMYFCRQYTILSLNDIGRIFKRDHATIIHAFRSVNNQIYTDKIYLKEFNALEMLIKEEIENIKYAELLYEEEMYMQNDCYI